MVLTYVWVYFWILDSAALVYLSILCQFHTVLLYLKVWNQLSPPTLFFFMKVVLTTLYSLTFLMIVRIALSLSTQKKACWDFNWVCFGSLNQFWENQHPNYINPSNS